VAKVTPRSKCLKAAQLLARISAADENGYCTCVSCGTIDHYKNMQGGHFIAKGSSSYWSLEPENIHCQCAPCNGFGMKYGIAAQQYTLYMEDTYGREFVEHMLETKSNLKKTYKAEYVEMLTKLNKLIAFHKERTGG